ncbi:MULTISPECIES: type VI secretion system Vgr family protein [unclassified Pseudomonas]|uniref:type VI secretion system Vgr family protein n=1 Tax=unclassified Pseudomonas TaxID=196821 RepID=UPI0021BB1EDE|nr:MULTISPECIES: type VI secretion system tip protein TssI/VgrG [unclassified Pseudomonas]MCT8166894.1 type VI secretion system tip protein VgrG [Pseudomonas sp. HD6422]MCT8185862.1 type VI secretion system tip protein VgrG [Pseudomonas sp. HD6421]
MPSQSDLRFTFHPLVGKTQFEVVSFSLTEAVSTPFKLILELISFEKDVDFSHLLDKPVLFTLWRADRPVRHVHGLVSSFTQGETGFYRTRYHAVIEPQLARAALRSNWRIFQQKTVPQILEIMLKRQGILHHELFSSFDHHVREFCVQAGETDLAFFARLAAEEGFVYRFEHSPKQHTVVFTDRLLALGQLSRGAVKQEDADRPDDSQASKVDTVLYHANSGGDQPRPCLRRLRYREQVRTSRQVQRDYTFTNPAYRQEHLAGIEQSPDYERFDYPGRYKRDAVGKPFTATRFTALRHDARTAEVVGDDERLQPGLSFTLTEHPREDLNVHWRVIEVKHEGVQFTSLQEEAAGADRGTHYAQTAVLVPGMAEWRPQSLPKPRVDGPHMATVVGPPGEEIYCDEWGRVKVSFPWDRESKNDEFSSCWVRVSQGWAGGGWGAMAIPRVGQDVIIQYVNADPDQPMITGRTYCGNQLPPYELPKHKTRMTIKSQTHKGRGFNELRFEDELGRQEVFIHAERDQNNVVKNDETTQVGNDRKEQVDHDETLIVGHDRRETVGNDEQATIGQHASMTIGGNHTIDVGANRIETVGMERRDQTGTDHTIRVGGHSRQHVEGEMDIAAGEAIRLKTQVFEINAAQSITLKGPGGTVRIDADGITVDGLNLRLKGAMNKDASGEGNSLEFTGKVQPNVDGCGVREK